MGPDRTVELALYNDHIYNASFELIHIWQQNIYNLKFIFVLDAACVCSAGFMDNEALLDEVEA